MFGAIMRRRRLRYLLSEIPAFISIPDAGECAYRRLEEKATDDAEKLKWRNCAAACKVVAMRMRKLANAIEAEAK